MRFAVVMAVAVAARAFFFVGVRQNDEFEYARRAHQMATGRFEVVHDVYAQRVGILAPTALFYRLGGVSNFTTTLWGELCSLGLVALAYGFALRLHSPRAALIAGLLAAVYPLDVITAGRLYGDVPVAFFMAAAAYLMWRRTSWKMLLAAGVVLGLGHLCKDVAVFLMPLVVLYAWVRRDRRVLWVGAGFALVVAAEMAGYAAATGRPLERFETSAKGHHREAIESMYAEPGTVGRRAFVDMPRMFVWPIDPQWPYFGLTAFALAAAAWSCRRTGRFFLAWWAIAALLINFWPLRIWPYLPGFALFERVMEPLTVPTFVLIGAWLAGWRRPSIAVAALVVPSLALCLLMRLYFEEWTRGLRGAHEALLDSPARVVYTDRYTSFYLEFWNGFEPPYEIRPLDRATVFEPGAHVVIHTMWLERTQHIDRTAVPPEAQAPPWPRIYHEDRYDALRDWRNRVVGGSEPARYTIAIYRIPTGSIE